LSAEKVALTVGDEENGKLIELRMLGARHVDPIADDRLPGVVNDLRGNDPRAWKTQIPTFERVRYPDLYPGISLGWYGNQRQLEYDFRLAPGADSKEIGIRVAGAEAVHVAGDGELVIRSGGETLRQRAPIAFQPARSWGQERDAVAARFVVEQNIVRFKLGRYDHERPLVIDPLILGYSTYLGGLGSDDGQSIAVAETGQAYITGWTASEDFDTVNAVDATGGDPRDAFVSKLSADGSFLVWSTYLGGAAEEFGRGIALDSNGAAYITGSTNSTNFSTANAVQPAKSGGRDAFVTKLPRTGDSLIYSTYLGGSASTGGEEGTAIAVDSAGSAYITGKTDSINFPITEAIEGDSAGEDAFVTKLAPSGSTLTYSTYLGGNGFDRGVDIAVNGQGAAFVTGTTASTDFNTVDQIEGDSGGNDVFISKLAPAGDSLAYSTYLGGSGADEGDAIAVDGAGAAYVTGTTSSADYDKSPSALFGDNGGNDAFVSKLDETGSSLAYSTYLGGSSGDFGLGIAVDAAGNAYVAGDTRSSNFPTNTPGSLPAIDKYSGVGDAFVTKISPLANSLGYSTFLGGSQADAANDIAVDSSSGAYIVGKTQSTNFEKSQPIEGPSGNGTCCGTYDTFVARLATDTDEVLARRFQPVLRFDEGERWRPLDVERMLSEESHYICNESCQSFTSFSQLAEYPSSKPYIDIGAPGDPGPAPRYSDPDHYYSAVCPPNGQVVDCESGPRSAIYYDTAQVSPSSYRYIQYWFFYRFNDSPFDDPPFEESLDHEGDWEQMALAVPSATALSAPTFDFANFGQHGANFTYLRENLTCDGDSTCGPAAKHVHGFVAGGTHATYGEPCSGIVPCTQSNSSIPETDHGGEAPWANNGDASALRRLLAPYEGPWEEGPHAWVDWPGWWGLDAEMTADRVASPANQDFYDFPWTATCVDSLECGKQFSVGLQAKHGLTASGASADCGQWFGSGIAVASCDRRVLGETVRAAEIGEYSGSVHLVLYRRGGRTVEAATTRGLAQLAAKPLRPGDRLLIRGRVAHRGTLLVRSLIGNAITVARFTERQLSDGKSVVVTVERHGSRAVPMLQQADGSSVAPESVFE
jgi:hypothetical protein